MNDYWAWEEDTSHAKSVLKFGVQLIILVITAFTPIICLVTVDHFEKINIIAMRNDGQGNGLGVFYVRISTDEYIHFWTEENNEIIPHSIDIGKCKFYESLDEGEEPYVKKGIGIFGNALKYEFYLQKGTLMRECRLE